MDTQGFELGILERAAASLYESHTVQVAIH